MIVLNAQNVCHSYPQANGKLSILENLNLEVKEGENIAIIGSSGSGKSTLLHILAGLDKPTSGKVLLCEQEFSSTNNNKQAALRNKYLGFIYQFHHLLAEFSAVENVMIPLLIAEVDKKLAKEKAMYLLEKVGVGQRAKHKPAELSGGERQRIAIARAMVTKPKCILADEPTGNLDTKTESKVMDLLFDLQRTEKSSLVIVTHDMRVAERMDKIYTLTDKKLRL